MKRTCLRKHSAGWVIFYCYVKSHYKIKKKITITDKKNFSVRAYWASLCIYCVNMIFTSAKYCYTFDTASLLTSQALWSSGMENGSYWKVGLKKLSRRLKFYIYISHSHSKSYGGGGYFDQIAKSITSILDIIGFQPLFLLFCVD